MRGTLTVLNFSGVYLCGSRMVDILRRSLLDPSIRSVHRRYDVVICPSAVTSILNRAQIGRVCHSYNISSAEAHCIKIRMQLYLFTQSDSYEEQQHQTTTAYGIIWELCRFAGGLSSNSTHVYTSTPS